MNTFWLVVWNMIFLTFHILEVILPTGFHIFQTGWNHQPAFNLHNPLSLEILDAIPTGLTDISIEYSHVKVPSWSYRVLIGMVGCPDPIKYLWNVLTHVPSVHFSWVLPVSFGMDKDGPEWASTAATEEHFQLVQYDVGQFYQVHHDQNSAPDTLAGTVSIGSPIPWQPSVSRAKTSKMFSLIWRQVFHLHKRNGISNCLKLSAEVLATHRTVAPKCLVCQGSDCPLSSCTCRRLRWAVQQSFPTWGSRPCENLQLSEPLPGPRWAPPVITWSTFIPSTIVISCYILRKPTYKST